MKAIAGVELETLVMHHLVMIMIYLRKLIKSAELFNL